MIKTIFEYAVLFVVMVLVQVICSHICLFGIAIPLIFIYFIIRLPLNLSVNWVMTLAFSIGLIIDMFNNTQGMNALACTTIAVLRFPIFSLYFSREEDLAHPIPSISTLGIGIYLKYLLSIVFVFCTLLFLIQSFSLHDIHLTLFRIVGSTILTTLLLFGIDSLYSTREKRL